MARMISVYVRASLLRPLPNSINFSNVFVEMLLRLIAFSTSGSADWIAAPIIHVPLRMVAASMTRSVLFFPAEAPTRTGQEYFSWISAMYRQVIVSSRYIPKFRSVITISSLFVTRSAI